MNIATDVKLFPIGPPHASALVRLFERNNDADTTARFDPFPLTAGRARAIAEQPRADLYFAAEIDGELVGMTMLRGWDEGYDVPSFGILVDRAHRGGGLGRALTSQTLERARAAGAHRVRLSVYASNTVALRLYEALGFVETEREPRTVAGRTDERIVMSLDLTRRS
jgi:ribosomal protein S18 acetylase RimI-like enzyme